MEKHQINGESPTTLLGSGEGGEFAWDPGASPREATGSTPRPLLKGPSRTALILLGVGKVGRALLRQIQEKAELHRQLYDLVFDVVAVSDSTAALLLEDPSQIATIVDWKERGQELCHHSRATLVPDSMALVEAVAEAGAILIDCTASRESQRALLAGLGKKCRVVLANKIPLSGSQQVFNALAGPYPGAPQARWEATVGAGLPLVSSLNRLRAAGDEILQMHGSLSSTLGQLFTGIQEGRFLSELVGESIQAGVAEPDPREDLSGRDLARKALILARTAGWKAEFKDVVVESLFPNSWEDLPVEEFLARLTQLDRDLEERRREAREASCCLRYVTDVSPSQIRVGLRQVPENSALARLRGSEQSITIKTSIYQDTPLVIQGRGAGVEATASAVLSDIVELVR